MPMMTHRISFSLLLWRFFFLWINILVCLTNFLHSWGTKSEGEREREREGVFNNNNTSRIVGKNQSQEAIWFAFLITISLSLPLPFLPKFSCEDLYRSENVSLSRIILLVRFILRSINHFETKRKEKENLGRFDFNDTHASISFGFFFFFSFFLLRLLVCFETFLAS